MGVDYESLLNSFVVESNEMLNSAEGAILELENNFDSELVNDVFRTFHTIKGDSGIFGLQKITDLSHALENVLDMIRDGRLQVTMTEVDVLLTGIDRLRQLINHLDQVDSIDTEDLYNNLEKILNSGEAAPEEAEEKLHSPDIVKQGEPGQQKEKFTIKIPKKYNEAAEQQRKYLSLVYIDLYNQQLNSLLEVRQMLDGLEDQGALLMQGVLENLLPENGDITGGLLPYYMLLMTEEEIEPFLERYSLTGKVLRRIHIPEETTGTAPAKKETPQLGGVKGEIEELPGGALFHRNDVDEEEETVEEIIESAGKTVEKPAEETGEPQPATVEAAAVDQQEKSSDMQDGSSKDETKPLQRSGGQREYHAETHLKVHVDLLDELINLAGETIIARNDLVQKVERTRDSSLISSTKKLSYLVTRLQESIMRTRLQEINTIFQRLPRLVRDVSLVTGKQVELISEGGDVELDKTLIDAIVDPVMHMVRNSIDHGIEAPEVRKRNGKPEKGLLRLTATLRGGNVIINIIDDGKGLNADAIKQKAIRKGLLNERDAAEVTREELHEMIFEPGFSTADEITQTSGRGVGMDVVRTNFKRVGGSVDVSSTPGKGTTVTATLPQTLSIITCLMIEIAGQLYALPQQNIEDFILLEEQNISRVENHLMYKLRGHLLPLVEIGPVLYPENEEFPECKYVAVVRSDKHRFGLMIDDIINPEEIVVKPLGEHFSGLTLFSGAAILGDGEAVLILDVSGLARFCNLQSNLREELERDESRQLEEIEQRDTGFLLVGVGQERFALPIQSLPRIEKIRPDQIEQFMGLESFIFNNEIVPLLRLERYFQLNTNVDGVQLYVLIFSVNGMRVGIIVSEIFNVIDNIPNIETGAYLGESVMGQAIINEHKTVVLDVFDLLSQMQSTRFKDLRKYLDQRKEVPSAPEQAEDDYPTAFDSLKQNSEETPANGGTAASGSDKMEDQ